MRIRIDDLIRRHAVLFMLIAFFVAIVSTLIVFLCFDDKTKAASLGDTFGIAAALLAGAALFGVALSIQDLKENQQQQQKELDALAAIARALTDPVVVARVEVRSDTFYYLYIENMGKSPAYAVRFDVQPREGLFPLEHRDINLADLDFIKHGFAVMAPGQKVSTVVAEGGRLREMREQGIEHVEEFTINVSYSHMPITSGVPIDENERREYHYSFNFTNQQRSVQPRGEIAYEIYRLHESLDKTLEPEGREGKRVRVSVKAKS